MATVTDQIERAIEREAPTWGIRPVPPEHRRLSGVDFAVLWGDLSLGLLVVLTGALLVPALGFGTALTAIVVGSVIGCVPLALVGLAGARERVPGMVLFRPVLGLRGSYVPSVLNIAQLVGWTGFEFWAMSQIANEISRKLFGFSSYGVWLAVVAVVCTALALGGPILVVRRWLERFGAWVIAALGAWITVRLLMTADLGAVWARRPAGGLGFWLAVDLVVAMPASWLPLVADYNRFARAGRASAVGTFGGYAIGNIWFYALGALLVLSARLQGFPGPADLGLAIASLAGGWVVLVALLVGETDEAFADIYSAAVSSQNIRDRLRQRGAIVAVGLAGVALAVWLGRRPGVAVADYEYFLFLLGSVFVPLFGVFVAEYFLLRRPSRFAEEELFPDDGARRGRTTRFNARAVVAWLLGFLVYQWSVPTPLAAWRRVVEIFFHGWLHLPFPLAGSAFGASMPSFLAAIVVYLALTVVTRGPAVEQRREGERADPPTRS